MKLPRARALRSLAAVFVLLVTTALTAVFANATPAVAVTMGNGWTEPLSSLSVEAGFLANGCTNPSHPGYGSYQSGKYHIGVDYEGTTNQATYALGAGTVKKSQLFSSSAPDMGYVVMIEHTAVDGTKFVAVYGHLNNAGRPAVLNPDGSPVTVTAGQQIGTLYALDVATYGGPHLHLGIIPGTSIPSSGWGTKDCTAWPDTNSFTEPMPYLNAHPATTGSSSNRGTLYFVKTQNTSSGMVEVHSAIGGNYQQSDLHAATRFGLGEVANGVFQMVERNLYLIKTAGTASGKIEIHMATASSNYQQAGLAVASYFNVANGPNGVWQMAYINNDAVLDLVFIKTQNTSSGKVEVFASYGPGYQQLNMAQASRYGLGEVANGVFQMEAPDLVFIKTQNTSSGKVEVFRASAGSGYQTQTEAAASVFGLGEVANGIFYPSDINGDGHADLVFVKTANTGSGAIEIHVTNGTSYQQISVAAPTWIGLGDAANGVFQIDNKC